MSARTAAVLAHLGGIDEIGLFVVPALLAIFALRWAERRSRSRTENAEEKTEELSGPEM